MGWGGVGLYSRSFNLRTLVMHTPWMLRYSWGGVGWGCVHVQLAHAGDAHAMNATVLMGCCGVGLCSCSFNLRTLVMHTPWMLRYSWGGVGWGCVHVQLAHAGDANAMNATVLMGCCGVGLCSCSFNLRTLVMHTPWMLRYSWGGVGWGCVHVPSTCTRWWCTRHECYGTHGVAWGGAVFMFNLHMLVMHTPWMLRYSWVVAGWGCVHVPSTCARWWCTRHEGYSTVLMGCCGVGLCSCSFNLHTLVMHTPWMLRYSWGGVGWGGDVNVQLNSHTYVMLRSTPTLT